ncbi:helix-loop-helix DNA-binding domain-containing protein [Chaetomium tenue]|uniref:Helix-loop-helix DNA-binding domain-containing protein n=1 Tax=Chaetomium tenue TaxID=1854479 RepID=A0ACB7PNR6_9PEZI|nr:helix-loop-helix DNA-binding domain-containing protein [Chaetomium globosum]
MDSSSWAVADHSVHQAPEDDFQQYLDMNGMGNLGDGMNYNFQDFQASGGPQLLQSHPREQLDMPMSGTDAPILLGPEQQQPQQPQQQQQQQQQQAIEYRYQRLKDQADLHSVVSTSSPVDMEVDPSSSGPTISNTTPGDLAKKMRKNAAKARAKGGIKQSPISKPLRRRTTTTPSLNAQVLSELAESAERNQDPQLLPTPMMQTSSSSTTGITDSEDSVSPEALNDTTPVDMPPPPIPKSRSARPSPYIAPQASAVPSSLQPPRPGIASPATPASLMKLSSPSNGSAGARADSQEAIETDQIETFELPESANFLNRATPSSNNAPTPTQSSQDRGSSKTPSLAPIASPSLAKPSGTSSATQSPQLLAGSGFGSRKTPQLLPRGSKKRGSVSSIPVSPALRPKISPSIKPLLPGGPDVEEAASHLLATKSNYQRILEGNTLPGVSYPSELSTNLTSKRTSHKIAEQGRRNRINSALLEIATLLPRPPKDSEGEGSDSKKDKDKGGGSAPNSKASTVEMAIEYIKQLQQEVVEANRRAEEAEKRLERKGGGEAAGV